MQAHVRDSEFTLTQSNVLQDEEDSPDFKTLTGHVYMYENCLAECQQQHLMKFCNCTVDIFFPIGPYPICKLVDFPCLARHNRKDWNYVGMNIKNKLFLLRSCSIFPGVN